MRLRILLILLTVATAVASIGLPLRAQAGGAARAVPDGQSPVTGPRWIAPLDRPVSLDLRQVRLEAALAAIDSQARLELSYTPRVVPVDRLVSLRGDDLTAREALEAVLRGTGVEAVMSPAGTVMLIRRAEEKAEPPASRAAAVGSVGGRVFDAATGHPIQHGLVSIADSTVSVSMNTTEAGGYILRDVPVGEHTIRTRRLGFKPIEQRIVIAEGRVLTVNFELDLSLSRLQEVVSTATGNRRRLELGNDITVINADSIVRTQPITSVTDLLEGRVPGMVIQRSSGAPGDPARIRLRGASSPRLSNDPIVIVDGIRVYSEQSTERGGNLAGAVGGTSEYSAPSPLDYIDPNSIETIEVIKGPSAATLYGQDAASGVIVITSKKGRAGPARWTMSAERGMTEMVGSYPELMLRWGHPVVEDARVFCPINNRSNGTVGKSVCLADSTVRFQMLNDPDLTVLDQGHRTAATVGVSGGSDALTYSVTGSIRDEVGLVKLPEYEAERFLADQGSAAPAWMRRPQSLTQWGMASRITAKLGPTANVSLSSNLSRTEQQRSELEQQLGLLMGTYLDRSTGLYYETSGLTGLLRETDSKLTEYHERATAKATKFTNGASLNWRPLAWLSTTADAGIDIVQRADEILLPHGFGSGSELQGRLRSAHGTSVMTTMNVRALAGVPLGRGFSGQIATGINYTGASVEDLSNNILGLLKGTQSPINRDAYITVGQRNLDQATFGWYIEPQLSHHRFWLSTGLRLDGGNTFGTRVKLPAFPKLSASYLLSDEPFFPWKNVIPLLRLRLAYGQAGRQPGPTDRLRLYGAAAPVWVDGQFVDGVVLETVGNSKLEPERSTEIEGGFDADLLDDRLTLSLTGYRKTTTDALLAVPLAPSVYGANIRALQNIGVIRNTGVEASVGARVLRSDRVTWDLNVAVSQRRNLVVELGPGVEPFWDHGYESVGGTRVVAGYPLFGRWIRPMLGYADANGNGILEPREVLVGDTAVYVGGTLPNYTANVQTTFSLLRGAIAVSAGFIYEDGMTQSNDVGRRLAVFTAGWNDPQSSLDEQARMWDPTGYSWIQTVSTLRFNSLAVTHNLSPSIAHRAGARAMSISLQGTNLGLRTNYRGVDPNVNAYTTGNAVTDNGVLPRPRTWQVRVNATY